MKIYRDITYVILFLFFLACIVYIFNLSSGINSFLLSFIGGLLVSFFINIPAYINRRNDIISSLVINNIHVYGELFYLKKILIQIIDKELKFGISKSFLSVMSLKSVNKSINDKFYSSLKFDNFEYASSAFPIYNFIHIEKKLYDLIIKINKLSKIMISIELLLNGKIVDIQNINMDDIIKNGLNEEVNLFIDEANNVLECVESLIYYIEKNMNVLTFYYKSEFEWDYVCMMCKERFLLKEE